MKKHRIDIYKSQHFISKGLINQMKPGYLILCQPYSVVGHVVNIKKGELETAIIESGGDYYTLPLDYVVLDSNLGCIRMAVKQGHSSCKIEFNFNTLPSLECRQKWWVTYCKMREQAFKIHIYV